MNQISNFGQTQNVINSTMKIYVIFENDQSPERWSGSKRIDYVIDQRRHSLFLFIWEISENYRRWIVSILQLLKNSKHQFDWYFPPNSMHLSRELKMRNLQNRFVLKSIPLSIRFIKKLFNFLKSRNGYMSDKEAKLEILINHYEM